MKRPDPRGPTQGKTPSQLGSGRQTGKAHEFLDENAGMISTNSGATVTRLDWPSGVAFLQAADKSGATCEISWLKKAGYIEIEIGSKIDATVKDGVVKSITASAINTSGRVDFLNGKGFGIVILEGGAKAFLPGYVIEDFRSAALTVGATMKLKVAQSKKGFEVVQIISVDGYNGIRGVKNIRASDNRIQSSEILKSRDEGYVPAPIDDPVHPGKLLEKYLIDHDWSAIYAAKRLGVTRETVYNVMRGTTGISPFMAKALARNEIGGTPLEWLTLQAKYDLSQPDKPQPKKRLVKRAPRS